MILKTSINNVSSFYLESLNNVIKVSDKYRDYLNKDKMHDWYSEPITAKWNVSIFYLNIIFRLCSGVFNNFSFLLFYSLRGIILYYGKGAG